MMNNGKKIVKLPPFEVKHVVATLRQTIDWGLLNLNVPSTWKETKGEGVTILVIDTGCPCTPDKNIHPDLKGCIDIEKCKSFVSSEGIEDLQGHGSHCCGVIGARDNDIGCVGYAPKCTIVTYKGLDKYGVGDMDQIVDALEYAANVLKPDIISMSLGSTFPYKKMENIIKKLWDMNIPIVAAGGNGGAYEGVNYPGYYDECITIGAYDRHSKIADFSAVGDQIDFAFPGVDIYSTYLNGGYAKLSGTSMATPAAAGVIALLISKHKINESKGLPNDCKTIDQIKDHLKKYSIDFGLPGKDKYFGWGIVDVSRMILSPYSIDDEYTPFKKQEKSLWKKILDFLGKIFKRG